MNRYFYSVESDNGVMFLHLFGNVYKNDSGDEKDYSCAEWTHFYVKVGEAKKMLATGNSIMQTNGFVISTISQKNPLKIFVIDISVTIRASNFLLQIFRKIHLSVTIGLIIRKGEGIVPHLFFSSKTAQDIRYGYSDNYPH